jgi:hypothetical protein
MKLIDNPGNGDRLLTRGVDDDEAERFIDELSRLVECLGDENT